MARDKTYLVMGHRASAEALAGEVAKQGVRVITSGTSNPCPMIPIADVVVLCTEGLSYNHDLCAAMQSMTILPAQLLVYVAPEYTFAKSHVLYVAEKSNLNIDMNRIECIEWSSTTADDVVRAPSRAPKPRFGLHPTLRIKHFMGCFEELRLPLAIAYLLKLNGHSGDELVEGYFQHLSSTTIPPEFLGSAGA